MYASLLFLLSSFLQLQYDDSRPVGDVAITLSNNLRDIVGYEYNPQRIKLDRMLPRRGKPRTPDDEFTAQADLVENLRATIDVLDVVGGYLYSLGYRAPRPEFRGQVRDPYDAWDLGKEANFLRVVLSPNGKTLAACDYGDRCITLWNVPLKKKLATLRKDGWTPSGEYVFAPDGKSLTARGQRIEKKGGDSLRQDSVVVWDLNNYEEKSAADLEVPGVGGCGTFTPDGKTLVVAAPADGVGGAIAYNPADGKKIKVLIPDAPALKPVTALAVSPDGKAFALGTKDGVILVGDLETGTTRHKIQTGRANAPPPAAAAPPNPPPNPNPIELLTFSRDGKMLASYAGSDGAVNLWDPATGKNIGILRSDPWLGHPTALAFSPNGKTLAFGGKKDGAHSAVELWDLDASGFRDDFRAESKGRLFVTSLAFSPDGRTLVTAGPKNPIEFWDLPAGKPDKIKQPALTPER